METLALIFTIILLIYAISQYPWILLIIPLLIIPIIIFYRRHKKQKTEEQTKSKKIETETKIVEEISETVQTITEVPQKRKTIEDTPDYYISYKKPDLNSIAGNFLFIDLETANSYNNAICQIGLIYISNGVVKSEISLLVNPNDSFSSVNTSIHNITSQKVKNSPKFPIAWEQISSYFKDNIIIGHNVYQYDLRVIEQNLHRYNIISNIETIQYIDTLPLARNHINKQENVGYGTAYSLRNLAKRLGINHEAHDAFEDCRACMELFLYLSTLTDIKTISNNMILENNNTRF